MTFDEFKSSLSHSSPPPGISYQLESLWYDGAGNWNKSHDAVQDVNGKDAAWIHAYLHRKEGDLSNAQYWYSRAGKKLFDGTLADEWKMLVQHFIQNS